MNLIARQSDLSRLLQFNIRVYGLLVDKGRLLVVDELLQHRTPITKLPGGALELGEGLSDCLIREFAEEVGHDIQVEEHFYTTDFFQQSILDPINQLLSVYYLIRHSNPDEIPVKQRAHDFDDRLPESNINLRWISLDELSVIDMSLPIDRVVVDLLLKRKAAFYEAKTGEPGAYKAVG